MRVAERCARLLVLAAWMGLLTYWSGQSLLPIDAPSIQGSMHGAQHWIAHLLAFGLLGLLANWALEGTPRTAVLAVLLTSVFGATDEYHQSFTPGRRAAVDDWVLDTLSATVALYVIGRLRQTRWQPYVRRLSPLVVTVAFILGISLAVRPNVASLDDVALRGVAHNAIQLVRDTRDLARQLRPTASG